MAGTIEGGKKAALKNKELYGDNFYKNIGMKGGRNGHSGGFTNNSELAKRAGSIGGKKSKRGKGYREQLNSNSLLIYKLYTRENKSVAEISRLIGIPYSSVLNYVKGLEWYSNIRNKNE